MSTNEANPDQTLPPSERRQEWRRSSLPSTVRHKSVSVTLSLRSQAVLPPFTTSQLALLSPRPQQQQGPSSGNPVLCHRRSASEIASQVSKALPPTPRKPLVVEEQQISAAAVATAAPVSLRHTAAPLPPLPPQPSRSPRAAPPPPPPAPSAPPSIRGGGGGGPLGVEELVVELGKLGGCELLRRGGVPQGVAEMCDVRKSPRRTELWVQACPLFLRCALALRPDCVRLRSVSSSATTTASPDPTMTPAARCFEMASSLISQQQRSAPSCQTHPPWAVLRQAWHLVTEAGSCPPHSAALFELLLRCCGLLQTQVRYLVDLISTPPSSQAPQTPSPPLSPAHETLWAEFARVFDHYASFEGRCEAIGRCRAIIWAWFFRRRLSRRMRGFVLAKSDSFRDLLLLERSFVSKMESLVRVYWDPLLKLATAKKSERAATEKELRIIFGKTPEILAIHRRILARLEDVSETSWPSLTGLGKVFLAFGQDFKTHAAYARNIALAQGQLQSLLRPECSYSSQRTIRKSESSPALSVPPAPQAQAAIVGSPRVVVPALTPSAPLTSMAQFVEKHRRNGYQGMDLGDLLMAPLNHVTGYQKAFAVILENSDARESEEYSDLCQTVSLFDRVYCDVQKGMAEAPGRCQTMEAISRLGGLRAEASGAVGGTETAPHKRFLRGGTSDLVLADNEERNFVSEGDARVTVLSGGVLVKRKGLSSSAAPGDSSPSKRYVLFNDVLVIAKVKGGQCAATHLWELKTLKLVSEPSAPADQQSLLSSVQLVQPTGDVVVLRLNTPEEAEKLRVDLSTLVGSVVSRDSIAALATPRGQQTHAKAATVACSAKVFGVALDALLAQEISQDGVPRAVRLVCCYIDGSEDFLRVEGLFRLSGSVNKLTALRKELEGAPKSSVPAAEIDCTWLHSFAQYDILTVASILKAFLRELPEPLLPRSLHADCMKLGASASVISREAMAPKLLGVLRKTSRVPVILRVLATLRLVADRREHNKMDSKNLSIVFAPNFFRLDQESLDGFFDLQKLLAFTALLVDHSPFLIAEAGSKKPS